MGIGDSRRAAAEAAARKKAEEEKAARKKAAEAAARKKAEEAAKAEASGKKTLDSKGDGKYLPPTGETEGGKTDETRKDPGGKRIGFDDGGSDATKAEADRQRQRQEAKEDRDEERRYQEGRRKEEHDQRIQDQKDAEEREDARWYAHQEYMKNNREDTGVKHTVTGGRLPKIKSSGSGDKPRFGRDIRGNIINLTERGGKIGSTKGYDDVPDEDPYEKGRVGGGLVDRSPKDGKSVPYKPDESQTVERTIKTGMSSFESRVPTAADKNAEYAKGAAKDFIDESKKDRWARMTETAAQAAANGATVKIGMEGIVAIGKPKTEIKPDGTEVTSGPTYQKGEAKAEFTGSRNFIVGGKNPMGGSATMTEAYEKDIKAGKYAAGKDAGRKALDDTSALRESGDKDLQKIASEYVKQKATAAYNGATNADPAVTKALAEQDRIDKANRESAQKPFSVADYKQRKQGKDGKYYDA